MKELFWLVILGAIPFSLIVLALVGGVRLWRQSSAHAPGSARTTLRWLAATLIEPTVNTAIVGATFISVMQHSNGNDFFWTWAGVPRALLISAPMAILLGPLAWPAVVDPSYRRVLLKLGVLGGLRWVITALTLVQPLGIVAGLGLLGFTIHWVKLQGACIIGRPQAIGRGPKGVIVAPLSDFGHDDHPGIRF
jgi:hypothetical protein